MIGFVDWRMRASSSAPSIAATTSCARDCASRDGSPARISTGQGFARVTTGALFDLEAAREAGYFDYVVDAAHLDNAAADAARRLYALDATSYAATKARVNGPLIRAIGAAWAAEGQRTWGRAA